MAASCPFCAIASGVSEAEIVLRNDHVTAFLDWKPFNPGHLLVIPNVHEPHFEELTLSEVHHVMRAVQALA
jgi:diadenosine tetraphosphate (Ap4A) HIT family hydrolase